MKKLFIVLAAAAMAVSVNAAKGDMVLSGTLGLNVDGALKIDGKKGMSIYNEDNVSLTTYTILPSFTYFVSDKVGVGAQVGYKGGNSKYFEDDKEVLKARSGAFQINPFVRYYVWSTSKFGVFGQATLGFAFGSSKIGDGDSFSTTDIGLSVTPGIQYFINRKWSIETTFANNLLGFNYSTNKAKESQTSFTLLNINDFFLPFNALAITLNYHF